MKSIRLRENIMEWRLTDLKILMLILSMTLFSISDGHAGFLDDLFRASQNKISDTNINQQQMITAVREALEQGSRRAIGSLGKRDGFLANEKVRIGVPFPLRNVERAMRKLGQGKTADEFIISLNRAAERATPLAKSILLDAIKKMSVNDVVYIVRGPDNAATEYFRKTTSKQLTLSMLPIIKRATNKVGVTRSYKSLIKQAGPLAAFVDLRQLDLDAYVTQKCLDGLFLLIADEERLIRKDPVARTTELLKKVFGRN